MDFSRVYDYDTGTWRNVADAQVRTFFADPFSETDSYVIGDYCIYDGALYRFTSAHTGTWNNNHATQVVAMNELKSLVDLIESRMTFKITGTVSASNYTLIDSRINSEHWEVDSIYFDNENVVTTKVHWTTNITDHTVTLGATYTGSTSVVVKMHWVQ